LLLLLLFDVSPLRNSA